MICKLTDADNLLLFVCRKTSITLKDEDSTEEDNFSCFQTLQLCASSDSLCRKP